MILDTPHDRRTLRALLDGALTEAQARVRAPSLASLLDAEIASPTPDPGPGHWDTHLDLRTESALGGGSLLWAGVRLTVRDHATSTCPSGPCGSRLSAHVRRAVPAARVVDIGGGTAVGTWRE